MKSNNKDNKIRNPKENKHSSQKESESQVKGFIKSNKFILLFLGVLSLISIASFLSGQLSKNSLDTVEVYYNQELYKTFDLKTDGEYILEDISYPLQVNVKDKKVYVTHATCPDKICEHTTPITTTNDIITCLPNKLYIKVK